MIVPQYLHEHSNRTQYHDQYRVDNQDHPSTMEFGQEYQEHDLKIFDRKKKKKIKFLYVTWRLVQSYSQNLAHKMVYVLIPFVPLGNLAFPRAM